MDSNKLDNVKYIKVYDEDNNVIETFDLDDLGKDTPGFVLAINKEDSTQLIGNASVHALDRTIKTCADLIEQQTNIPMQVVLLKAATGLPKDCPPDSLS